jgi:hypothetical protein
MVKKLSALILFLFIITLSINAFGQEDSETPIKKNYTFSCGVGIVVYNPNYEWESSSVTGLFLEFSMIDPSLKWEYILRSDFLSDSFVKQRNSMLGARYRFEGEDLAYKNISASTFFIGGGIASAKIENKLDQKDFGRGSYIEFGWLNTFGNSKLESSIKYISITNTDEYNLDLGGLSLSCGFIF